VSKYIGLKLSLANRQTRVHAPCSKRIRGTATRLAPGSDTADAQGSFILLLQLPTSTQCTIMKIFYLPYLCHRGSENAFNAVNVPNEVLTIVHLRRMTLR